MNELAANVLEHIAKLAMKSVSAAEIAAVVGLTPERVAQIQETEEYQNKLAILTVQEAERMDTLNKGWDLLEKTSLNTLLGQIEANPDPDFLLRAATMANRANRRGVKENRIINGELSGRAVVTLPAMFVQHIQNGGFSLNQTHVDAHTQGEEKNKKNGKRNGNGNGHDFGGTEPDIHAPAPSLVEVPRKIVDAMNPAQVEGLLQPSSPNDASVLDAVAFAVSSVEELG